MWSQKKKSRRAKLHNKMIDNLTPFLDQLLWQYLCFAKHFLSFVNLRMFWWQYGWWYHLSQTQLVSCSPSSDLDSWKFCNYSNEWPKTHHDNHISSELYHGGCMQFVEVGATSLKSNRCWLTNSSGKGMSILAKTFK
jgi:hypothetical protein